MRKPVWIKTKVEDDLRCRFKGAVMEEDYAPAEAIRMFMERVVERSENRNRVDLTLWSNAVRDAADDVADDMCIGQPEPPYGEEDEVQRARRQGWASPGFGRD